MSLFCEKVFKISTAIFVDDCAEKPGSFLNVNLSSGNLAPAGKDIKPELGRIRTVLDY